MGLGMDWGIDNFSLFGEMMSVEDCSNKSRRRAEANSAIFQEIFALAAEMGVTPLDEQMDIEELITRNAMIDGLYQEAFRLRTVLLKHHIQT